MVRARLFNLYFYKIIVLYSHFICLYSVYIYLPTVRLVRYYPEHCAVHQPQAEQHLVGGEVWGQSPSSSHRPTTDTPLNKPLHAQPEPEPTHQPQPEQQEERQSVLLMQEEGREEEREIVGRERRTVSSMTQ